MLDPTSQRKQYRRRRVIQWLFCICLLVSIVIIFLLRLLAWGSGENNQLSRHPDAASTVSAFSEIPFPFGRAYSGEGWQLYFNEPAERTDRAEYQNGMDAQLAAAINSAQHRLDIAAFELNSDPIAEAILSAHERGVAVRIVTDDDHGLNDKRDGHLRELRQAGIAVADDSRTGLMHNKFLIVDRQTVWTGSWNFTVNGTYRNNNNALVLESPAAAGAYLAEFDEMFLRGEFGARSSDDGVISFKLGDGRASIVFAPEADEIQVITAEIAKAERAIRLMVFVFSLEELAQAMLNQAANPAITIEGVFETRNSTADWSQLPALHCAGASIRQDGNRYTLHHKVIIIDEDTVISGSFNFSRSAAESNDENIIIIRDAAIASLYLDEWRRIWAGAEELAPDEVTCD